MKKRTICLTLAVTMIIGLLTGCGKSRAYTLSPEKTAITTDKGITTWISSSPDSDERRLELDASPLSAKYTVVEVSNGKITAIELSGNILTR